MPALILKPRRHAKLGWATGTSADDVVHKPDQVKKNNSPQTAVGSGIGGFVLADSNRRLLHAVHFQPDQLFHQPKLPAARQHQPPGLLDSRLLSHPAIMDTGKAKRELGWRPKYTGIEALRDTLRGA